jgi:plastocyanin
MRKRMWSAAAVLVLLSGAGMVFAVPHVLAADSQVGMVEGSQSDYHSWKFDPVEITVPAGTTVVWQNKGQLDHTATAENGSFDSGNLKPGGSFQFKFSTPGDYKYFCTPHKDLGMIGVVHVSGATAATAPGATTTTAAATATTATTRASAAPTTTTTANAGASSTTTTATTAANGAASTTTTTAAAATTPTTAAPNASSNAAGESTTTTTAPGGKGGEESASGGRRKTDTGGTNGPLVAVAAVLTALLLAITGRLLVAKS